MDHNKANQDPKFHVAPADFHQGSRVPRRPYVPFGQSRWVSGKMATASNNNLGAGASTVTKKPQGRVPGQRAAFSAAPKIHKDWHRDQSKKDTTEFDSFVNPPPPRPNYPKHKDEEESTLPSLPPMKSTASGDELDDDEMIDWEILDIFGKSVATTTNRPERNQVARAVVRDINNGMHPNAVAAKHKMPVLQMVKEMARFAAQKDKEAALAGNGDVGEDGFVQAGLK